MEPPVVIRTLRQKDIDQVLAIEKSTFSMPWTKRDFEATLDNPQNLYLVVDNGREILGYCGLLAVLDEGQITNVAIRADQRHRGLGHRMLEVLLMEGQERGLTAFTLEVRESNASARALYKRLGFKEAGVRPGFYERPREGAVIMWYHCNE